MDFLGDEEMMDYGERDQETYFTAVEWPAQQSARLSHSKPLVHRPAVSGVLDAEEASPRVVGGNHTKPLVLRPAVSGVLGSQGASSRFVQDYCTRSLVHRTALSGIPEAEESSLRSVRENRTRPLVLRPAVPNIPATKKASPQVVQKNGTKSLVLRPAILKNPRRHDLSEQARIMQPQSTLPYRPRVTDKSRDSRRRYKEAVRKWIERKREREERERQSERRKLSESRESDRFGNSHHEIDSAIIKQEIQDINADLHRTVGKDEHETLQACNPPSDEWHRIMPISETKMSTDTLISALVVGIMKKRQHADEVKNFVNKKHTLEEWQNWGKILAERMDKGEKTWEEYREMMKKEESRVNGGQKFDESTRGEWPWETRSIQPVYYLLGKLDRALEEAENRLSKTHCESKEVEREGVEQRTAKREKTQFVRTKVRDYVDSDSDDLPAMGTVKHKQLPLRQKKHRPVTRVDSGDGDVLAGPSTEDSKDSDESRKHCIWM